MSGLCGWIRFNGRPSTAPESIERMAARLGRFDGGGTEFVRGAIYAMARVGGKNSPALYSHQGDAALLFGRMEFDDPTLAQQARTQGIAETLAAGFRKHGAAILKSARGRFCAVVVLEREQRALLAVDRLSVYPLTFTRVPGGVVFGSDTATVNLHPDVSREIDPQQIYNYLYFHMVPSPASVYRQHARVRPGGYALITGSEVETGSYWQPEYTRESARLPIAELRDEFRALLKASVRRELAGQNAGAFLSGGTDSSTVAGTIGEVSGKPARTYSIGFDAEGYDETRYARIAAGHFHTEHHEYYVTPQDVVAAVPKLAEIHAEPFGNSSAVPTYYCARMARADGVTRLLAGDGGDELFGGNSRYATQGLFSLYSDLPAALRKYAIEPFVFALPGGEQLLPIRKLRSYIRQASVPMPARLETYNLLERLGRAEVLTPEFLSAIDPNQPLAMLTEVYTQAHADSMLNRMLAMDLKFTLADNDLPKVTRTAELAGVEVGYPLLSDELMDFAARLPVRLKLRGTRLRYFFKQALSDFLPRAIIEKKKHGFGLPFGPWLNRDPQLRQLAFDALGNIKRRGIVRAQFVDALLEQHLPSHPGFYGTMVWLLMMLEYWHQHHVDSPR